MVLAGALMLPVLASAAPDTVMPDGAGGRPVIDCVRIDDALQRLACYDSREGRAATGTPAPAGPRIPPLSNPPAVRPPPELTPPADTFQTPALETLLPGGSGPLARAVQDVRRSLGTTLADRWELDDATDRGRFLLRPYKPMYAIVGDWTSRTNRLPTSPNPNNRVTEPLPLRSAEAKFQVSLKTKVWEDFAGDNGDLWLGYTQTSYWQIYNGEASRPFRETNYEPEIMAVFRTRFSILGWDGRMVGLSLNHQSNGRAEPLSRSWNRVIAQVGFERRNWMLMIRPWWRISEPRDTDDNPDIQDHLGRADLLLVRKSEGHELSLLARHSLRSGSRSRGSLQIDYAFPISSYLKAYLQVFNGYGASLIDYNHRQTRIGLGISLVQWL